MATYLRVPMSHFSADCSARRSTKYSTDAVKYPYAVNCPHETLTVLPSGDIQCRSKCGQLWRNFSPPEDINWERPTQAQIADAQAALRRVSGFIRIPKPPPYVTSAGLPSAEARDAVAEENRIRLVTEPPL